MSKLPNTGLVRVHSASGAVAGSAFLACGEDGKAYALTCAHVVNTALGRPALADGPLPPDAAVVLSCAPGPAKVLHWIAPVPPFKAKRSPLADIAVLDPGVSPDRSWPALRTEPPERVVAAGDVPFQGFGFMGPEDGLPVKGVLRDVDMGGWFVLRAAEGFGTFVEGGVSGAPLLGDDRRVLGMAVQRLGKEGSFEALAIPAMVLARAWPLLARPYVGPRSFQAGTAHLFFGRAKATAALRERLSAQPIVAVVGASGAGKSSLVRAGLVPLMAAETWRPVVFEPKQHPLAQLAEAVARAARPDLPEPAVQDAADQWRGRLRDGGLDPVLTTLGTEGRRGVLFVVDQFEQFFTADPDRADAVAADRGLILRMLREAAGRDDVRVVLTLRLDLMGRVMAEDPAAAKLLRDPLPPFVLDRMGTAELREAVVEGAALFDVDVDPGFAATLAAEAAGHDGMLPPLQSALSDLWRGIRQREGRWRLPGTGSATAGFAGLSGALQDMANRAVDNLENGRRGEPVPAALMDRVLSSLVRLSGPEQAATKRVVPGPREGASADPKEAQSWGVLRRLAAERLVILGEAGGAPTAELVHDALTTQWPRLAGIIARDRDFLRWLGPLREFQVPAWANAGRGTARVLTGSDVAVALDWLAARGDDLTTDEADFIRASSAEQGRTTQELTEQLSREQRLRSDEAAARQQASEALAEAEEARRGAEQARRRSLAAFWVVAVLAMAIAGVAGIAWGGLQVVTYERDQAQLAQSRVLARQAGDALIRGDAVRAYLLAAQADDWAEHTGRPEARNVRHNSGGLLLGRPVKGTDPGSNISMLSEGGRVALTIGREGHLYSLDPPGAEATDLPRLGDGDAGPVRLSRDGSRVLLARNQASEFRVSPLQPSAGTSTIPWRPNPAGTMMDLFDDALQRNVFVTRAGIEIIDLNTGARRFIVQASPPAPMERPVRLTEKWLITEDSGDHAAAPAYRLRQLATGSVVELGPGVVPKADTSDRGDLAILVESQNGLGIWSDNPARKRPPVGLPGPVSFAVISPDASAAVAGTIPAGGQPRYFLVDLKQPGGEAKEILARTELKNGWFSQDGRRLLLFALDGTVLVLDLASWQATPSLSPRLGAVFAISADGRWLTMGGVNGWLQVWDVDALLNSENLDATIEARLRELMMSGAAKCIGEAELASLGAPTPNDRAAGPHACPLGPADAQHASGFWRRVFLTISRLL